MTDLHSTESHTECGLYLLYLIKSSGIIQFNWYSNEDVKKKWKEDEVLFSGFLIALNAIGQIFFEGKSIRSIHFDEHQIVFRSIYPHNELLCLVCSKNCLEEDIEAFLLDTTGLIQKYPSDQECVNSNWTEKFSAEFERLIADYQQKKTKERSKPLVNTQESIIESTVEVKTINLQKPIFSPPLDREKILDLGRGLGNAFNNVLSIILGNINLAKMDAKPESEQMECLNDAETSLSRAKVLSSLLLSISNKISSFKSQINENKGD